MFGKRCTERLSRPSRRREGRREHVGKGWSSAFAFQGASGRLFPKSDVIAIKIGPPSITKGWLNP